MFKQTKSGLWVPAEPKQLCMVRVNQGTGAGTTAGTGGAQQAAAGGGGGAAAPLFRIDFSGEANADPFVPANYGCTEDTTSGNDGNITSGKLQMDGSVDHQSFHVDQDELDLDGVASFYAELGGYIPSENSTTDGGALALLADAYNPGAWGVANAYGSMDGYYVEIGAFSSHMRVNVFRVVNGSGSFLGQYAPGSGYPIAAGTTVRAEVTIQAGQTDIVIKLNGTTVLTINDSNAARIQNFRTVGAALAYSVGATSITSMTVDEL